LDKGALDWQQEENAENKERKGEQRPGSLEQVVEGD
jgi:hypothetical protein